jgi:hypothetical protein
LQGKIRESDHGALAIRDRSTTFLDGSDVPRGGIVATWIGRMPSRQGARMTDAPAPPPLDCLPVIPSAMIAGYGEARRIALK